MPSNLVDDAPAYEVLRPFTALGRDLQRGDIVEWEEAKNYRNLQPLINDRRLKPLPTYGLTRDGDETSARRGRPRKEAA